MVKTVGFLVSISFPVQRPAAEEEMVLALAPEQKRAGTEQEQSKQENAAAFAKRRPEHQSSGKFGLEGWSCRGLVAGE